MKIINNLEEAIRKVGLEDGMTISFHHHLRNGDFVLNMVLNKAAEMGIKNLTIAPSAIFPVHSDIIKYLKSGVIKKIECNYMSGEVGEAVSEGIMDEPVIFRSHGGRARAIAGGELKIDAAFLAAPAADSEGNINGINGKAACGSLGYAFSDAVYADKVIAVTDNIEEYPLTPVSIDQTYVDYVVEVEKIGDPEGIVSGTTQVTQDPVGLKIAEYAAAVIEEANLLKDGLNFQTGAGGISLAVAEKLKDKMIAENIIGNFAMGGITSYLVKMMEEGLFKSILDVQCFDLEAVRSIRENIEHQEISSSWYANPESKSCAVDMLDVVILGAAEIDTEFNVNVLTNSNGVIIGGSGGHNDTAAGAKLTIVVTPLFRTRLPIVVDQVLAKTTPGEHIDVLVTERGIAVNPADQELYKKLKKTNLPITTIEKLKEEAEKVAGKPQKVEFSDNIIALVEARDGEIIDKVRQPLLK